MIASKKSAKTALASAPSHGAAGKRPRTVTPVGRSGHRNTSRSKADRELLSRDDPSYIPTSSVSCHLERSSELTERTPGGRKAKDENAGERDEDLACDDAVGT